MRICTETGTISGAEVLLMKERSRPFVRMTIACLFFLTAVALNILLPRYWHNIPEIVKHLLLLFSAIMCVHIMEYAYMWYEIFGHIRSILKETLQTTHQLIDDNRSALEKSLQSTNKLAESAATCGLSNVYCSRKDVKSDIYDAIENAGKRLWLLGITLSENIHLDELLSTLNKKITRGIDVKILLLDAFQGPAVFRTLIESAAQEIVNSTNANGTKREPTDVFFHQRLYSDFTHVCDRLLNYPNVGDRVRFYTYCPTCWMMIVDNVAHFQPYTYGQSTSQHPVNVCTSANMPVFKFQMQPNGRPFEILEDHFLKLWMTSNVDLFHVEAKIADRNRIIKDVFNFHPTWFKHAYAILHTHQNKVPSIIDKRKSPRQSWEWNQPTLSIYLPDLKIAIHANICDYSHEGMSVQLENANLKLSEKQVVLLQGTPPVEPLAANFVADHFLKTKRFMVKRMTNGTQPIVGLQATLESEGNCEL